MKSISRVVFLIMAMAVSLAACGSAHAQTLSGHAQFGPSITVDLLHARVVDLTPGAQKVTDHNGTTYSGAFPNDSAFLTGDFFPRYVQVGNVYYNVTEMGSVQCDSATTVINWLNGLAERRTNDGCSFFAQVKARARR